MSSKLGVQNIAHTNGTNAMTIASDGVTAFTNAPSGIITTKTTQATTSGTAFNFTSIPSTVKRISVLFRGISLSGSDGLIIQLGTSGGLVTSGYASLSHWGGGGLSSTSGFIVDGVGNSNIMSGIMTIAHMGSNIYVASHSCKYNTSNGVFGGGDVSIGGTVDRLTITRSGSNTFDAGSVNIMYES
jgi:hypothetical protein